MEFHEKLQAFRKQSGLTQEELAQKLYVSRTAVSKWESGRGYPNLDSLKAIATYFSVTVDELLSGDEVVTLAQDEQQRARSQLCDLVFGLLNMGVGLLFVLPCFKQMAEGTLQAVSLIGLTGVSPYMRYLYWDVTIGLIICGVSLLVLVNCRRLWWMKHKYKISLALNAVGVLLFILGSQPYAAVLLFVFLAIQALLLLKR